MFEQHQLILITENARDVDQITRVSTAIILDEGSVDGPFMVSPVRIRKHAGVCSRTAHDFSHIRILGIIIIGPKHGLLPDTYITNEDEEGPVYDDSPGSHIAIRLQRLPVFHACSLLSKPAQRPRPIQQRYGDQARGVEDSVQNPTVILNVRIGTPPDK